MISLLDIYQAAHRIGPDIRRTPLERSEPYSERFGVEVWLKLECWQTTGSFKLRGALNKLRKLTEGVEAEQRAGLAVVAASAGNHGLGVAHAARLLGIPATVVVPETASRAKIEALRRTGVELIEHGANYDEAEVMALETSHRTGAVYVSPYNDPDVIAGQGTIALEVLADRPDAELLVVPIGGGGLISGLAVAARAINPRIRIVGVQPSASPVFARALAEGRIVGVEVHPTLADGLAGNVEPRSITFAMVRDFVDEVLLVEEDAIAAAMVSLVDDHHLVVEGAGAVGLAALLAGDLRPNGRTVVVVTGRNVSGDVLGSVLRRELAPGL